MKMSVSDELQVCFGFFREIDTNGSCTWEASPRKITICYYFNNENINIIEVHEYLNSLSCLFCTLA